MDSLLLRRATYVAWNLNQVEWGRGEKLVSIESLEAILNPELTLLNIAQSIFKFGKKFAIVAAQLLYNMSYAVQTGPVYKIRFWGK